MVGSVLHATNGRTRETLELRMFVDEAANHREEVTQTVGFHSCRFFGVSPRHCVNDTRVSHFKAVSVIWNGHHYFFRVFPNSDKRRGIIEEPDVLNRSVDFAHLSVSEHDWGCDG